VCIRRALPRTGCRLILGNYNNLASIIYHSFAGLGLMAGGSTISAAQLLQPGRLAQVGIDAGKPILDSISGLMGFVSFFDNFIQIIILLIAWLTGTFEIPAGGRRNRALERPVKQKRLSKAASIPSIVRRPTTDRRFSRRGFAGGECPAGRPASGTSFKCQM
jgi:hypothetical protein